MRTQKSRRVACAFESLEGRALMAAYIKLGDIKGEVAAQRQQAEVHIAQPPAPTPILIGLLLPAVQGAREAAR